MLLGRRAPQSHFFSGALPLQMAGVGGYMVILNIDVSR